MILWLLGVVLVAGAAVGGGLYYLQQQDAGDEGEDDTDDADIEDANPGLNVTKTQLRIGGAVAGGAAVIVAFAVTALLLNGLFGMLAFVGALILGAGVPLAGVAILKDGFPLGGAVAPLLAILGQYVLGKGAVVRRQDGGYEWHRLVDTAQGYVVQLDDGTVLNVTGDRGDLYRFGGRPLAILEEKGRNVEQYTVREEPPETAAESTREVRAGMDVHHPERLRDDTFLISLKQLAQPAAGSAGPHLVQRGRAKALEEAGGEQAIGTFWLMIATAMLAVLGFVLGFGMLML